MGCAPAHDVMVSRKLCCLHLFTTYLTMWPSSQLVDHFDYRTQEHTIFTFLS